MMEEFMTAVVIAAVVIISNLINFMLGGSICGAGSLSNRINSLAKGMAPAIVVPP